MTDKLTATDGSKRPNQRQSWNKQQREEFKRCITDPLFFMTNFMYIQHPKKGRMLFKPFDYQVRMLDTMAENRYSCLLTGRQMGKCVSYDSAIKYNENQIKIGKLVPLNLRDWCVSVLERILIRLSKK